MSTQQVQSVQRERLMAACTEVLAHSGWGGVTVTAVVGRAGVSRSAFYQCFDDMQACATAGYDRFISVLLSKVTAVLDSDAGWPAWIGAVLGAYLGTLQADRVVAVAYQVEMDAAGAAARRLRRQALDRFADLLHQRYQVFSASDRRLGPLPRTAHLAVVHATRQLACDLLEDGAAPDLRGIVPDMTRVVAAEYLGSAHVAEVVGP